MERFASFTLLTKSRGVYMGHSVIFLIGYLIFLTKMIHVLNWVTIIAAYEICVPEINNKIDMCGWLKVNRPRL